MNITLPPEPIPELTLTGGTLTTLGFIGGDWLTEPSITDAEQRDNGRFRS
ncbi:hypothetical protein AAEY46_004412 [Yersinia enterocolitica]